MYIFLRWLYLGNMWLLCIKICVLYINVSKTSDIESIKKNIALLMNKPSDHKIDVNENIDSKSHMESIEHTVKKWKSQDEKGHIDTKFTINPNTDMRRRAKKKPIDDETYLEISTSEEMTEWKKDYMEHKIDIKLQAIPVLMNKTFKEDNPMFKPPFSKWAVECGDPEQHDIPWGTCMLAIECSPEHRLYRGDSFCGRSPFVCCSIMVTQHDLYEAFDRSSSISSGSTTSEEKTKRGRGQLVNKRRKRMRARIRLMRDRKARKQRLKKQIRIIARHVRKQLNRAFRNTSANRKKKMRALKRFIDVEKQRFLSEREVVKDVLAYDLNKIDKNFLKKLDQVEKLNRNFLLNQTYRNILLKKGLRTQRGLEAYSTLLEAGLNDTEVQNEQLNNTRRFGSGFQRQKKEHKKKNYLEYDIEYGNLYF